MSVKYCENCGAAMSEESKFCTECGTPFPTVKKEEKPAPRPENTPEEPLKEESEEPVQQKPDQNEPVQEPPRPASDPIPQEPVRNPSSYSVPVQGPATPIPPVQNPQASAPAQPAQGAFQAQQAPAQNPQMPRPANQAAPAAGTRPGGSYVPPQAAYAPAAARPVNQPVGVQSAPAAAYVPGAVSSAYMRSADDLKGTSEEPIRAWGWVGIFLLLGIPVVNLILLIVWACGGCRKNAKKSFARGVWLMVLISVVLIAVVGAAAFYALFPVVEPAINEILEQFGYKIVLG